MGGFVLYLAGAEKMTGGPGLQVAVGRGLGSAFARIESWLAPVPEPLLGLALLGLAAGLVLATLTDRRRRLPPEPSTAPCCHAVAELAGVDSGKDTGHE